MQADCCLAQKCPNMASKLIMNHLKAQPQGQIKASKAIWCTWAQTLWASNWYESHADKLEESKSSHNNQQVFGHVSSSRTHWSKEKVEKMLVDMKIGCCAAKPCQHRCCWESKLNTGAPLNEKSKAETVSLRVIIYRALFELWKTEKVSVNKDLSLCHHQQQGQTNPS